MLRIQWIADFSDYRIDYTRYSWMKLAQAGKVHYEEISKSKARREGVSPIILSALKEGISCFLVRSPDSSRILKIIVDDCDGFSGVSEQALKECDLYFVAAYLPSLYKDKIGITTYPWQADYAMEHYRKRAANLIANFGKHFHKVRPFIPLQMQMWDTSAKGVQVWNRKVKRFIQKTRYGNRNIFSLLIFRTFDERYASVIALRNEPLEYDVVVTDSLWAWPGHRVELHLRLRELAAKGRKIISRINPMGLDVSKLEMGKSREHKLEALSELVQPVVFPLPYEKMLARSRLCVFATGKHWGWREVAFVTLACGIPTLMDKPAYQTYFGFERFRFFYTENEWDETERCLDEVTNSVHQKRKIENQQLFDETCSPEAVGKYLFDQISATLVHLSNKAS